MEGGETAGLPSQEAVQFMGMQNGRNAADMVPMAPFTIKPEPQDDFVVSNVAIQPEPEDMDNAQMFSVPPPPTEGPTKAKRAKKAAVKKEPVEGALIAGVDVKQEKITGMLKERKKRDRFNGMSEEEVLKRVLPDHLAPNLDIAIIGINPGLCAAYVGHHYAGPGNHFWKCLLLSGLIPHKMNAYDDFKLLEYGIGFTNIVERTSRGSADLSKKEIKEGGEILLKKIQKYKPRIAVFNGKGIYEVFSGKKTFPFGKQENPFPGCDDTLVFVMPSSSARCTQLPRAIDKVPFYAALKKLRDHLRGDLLDFNEEEVTFKDVFLKTAERKDKGVKQEPGAEGKPEIKKEPGTEAEKPKRKRRSKKEMEAIRAAQAAALNGGSAPAVDAGMPALPAFPPLTSMLDQQASSTITSEPQAIEITPTSQPQQTSTGDTGLDALLSNNHELVKQEDTTELADYGVLGALPYMQQQANGMYAGVPTLPHGLPLTTAMHYAPHAYPPTYTHPGMNAMTTAQAMGGVPRCGEMSMAPGMIPMTTAPAWHLHQMQNVPYTSQQPYPAHTKPTASTLFNPYTYPGPGHWAQHQAHGHDLRRSTMHNNGATERVITDTANL